MANIPFLNNAYFSAKVGIGTESPSDKLTLNSSGSGTGFKITGYQPENFINLNNILSTGNRTFRLISGITSVGYDGFSIFDTVSNATRFVIDNTGNVGIVTTTPTYKLVVGGDVDYSSGIGTTNAIFVQDANYPAVVVGVDNQNYGYIRWNVSGGYLSIATKENYANQDNTLVLKTGNVGIGTTSPTAAKLVVDSDTAPQILVKNSGGGNAQILFEDNDGLTQSASITFDQAGDNTLSITTEYDSPNDLNKIKLVPGGEVAMTLSGGDDSTGTNGSITFNGYVGTRQTGTPTYLLGTDASGNIVKTNTIPGSAAGPYLPLAGGTMTGTNGVLFPDNFILNIGNSSDLKISHDGTDSFIEDSGTGSLYVTTNAFRLLNPAENEQIITAFENGAVNLFYDSSKKLATTSTGVSVTGDIQIDSALLSNQENTDVDTGTETVANVAIATYTAAFFDFVVKKTTNVRSGTVYACHDGTNVEFTETSTNDLGDTSDVTLSVDILGTNMRLLATVTSDDWSVKSLIRAI